MLATPMTALAAILLMSQPIPAMLQSSQAIPSEDELTLPEVGKAQPRLEVQDPELAKKPNAEVDTLEAEVTNPVYGAKDKLSEPPITIKDDLSRVEPVAETSTPDLETYRPTIRYDGRGETTDAAAPQVEAETPRAEIIPAPTPRPQAAAPELSAAEKDRILRSAETALAKAETAQGKFRQSNPDGSEMTGTFALRRPGKMRFDYDDPTPILIVSDGTTIAMEDSELETVDRIPLNSTPLGLILDSELKFGGDINVLSVQRGIEAVSITVEDATGEIPGTLSMVFDIETYDLRGWLAVDGDLQTTVIELTDVKTNKRVDPRLFRLDDQRDEEDER